MVLFDNLLLQFGYLHSTPAVFQKSFFRVLTAMRRPRPRHLALSSAHYATGAACRSRCLLAILSALVGAMSLSKPTAYSI